MDTKTSNETRKKETSHALICNTSTMRIERNVKTENTQQVKIALKLPKTVYGVPVTVTYTIAGEFSGSFSQ
jgi:late competence protein required for DNA uptake (superfamily II DNA/RNA helicase)